MIIACTSGRSRAIATWPGCPLTSPLRTIANGGTKAMNKLKMIVIVAMIALDTPDNGEEGARRRK